MATNENRCWPGYEPVPGTTEHEQGSCRKKPASRSTPSEKQFQQERKKQHAQWQSEYKGSRRSAAQTPASTQNGQEETRTRRKMG